MISIDRKEHIKILIVDDDAENIKMMSGYLKQLGYKVLIARDGDSAIEKLEHVTPDLILLDVLMPNMNGFEVAKVLQEHYLHKEIPIIFMTALSDIDSKLKGFSHGAKDYVSKPFNFDEVKVRVETHLKLSLQQKVLEEKALEEVAMNQELRALNEELLDLNKQLKTAHKHLAQSEKMGAYGSMFAGFTYEVNSPVSIATTASTMILDLLSYKDHINEETCADIKEAASLVYDNLKTISGKLKNFEQYSRDHMNNECRLITVNAYCNDVLNSLKPMVGDKSISIQLECDQEIMLESYPGVLSQVITSIVMNAYEHAYEMDESGTILVEIEALDQDISIKIIDDGCGMSLTKVHKIFDPFFTTKREKGFVGIGLYNVYHMVNDQLGGSVSCNSELGVGTSFQVLVPIK